MAQKVFDVCTLRITFITGYNELGKATTATKNFTGVKEEVVAAQLEQFATAYAALSTNELSTTVVSTQHTIES